MKTYNVSDCFRGKNIAYRDSDIDNWLPKKLHVIEGDKFNSHDLTSEMTFKEMAREFCGTTDESELKKHCLSLQQIEALLKTDNVLTNGYANLFLVEDEDGNVFGLRAFRIEDGWDVNVNQFDFVRRWLRGSRFFSRNSLDTSSVGDLESAIETVKKAGYVIYKQI